MIPQVSTSVLVTRRGSGSDSTSSTPRERLDAAHLALLVGRSGSDTASSTESSCGGDRVGNNDNNTDSNATESNCGEARQAADLRVRALLRTRAGLSIPLHPDLVKRYKDKLSNTFKALEQTWRDALRAYAKDLDVVRCDFLLGPQLVRYEDSNGKIHTVSLLDDLEKARDNARGQGDTGLADDIDEAINSILEQREGLKSVVAKMWGVNGNSPLVFSTDVRNTPDGHEPFIRDGVAEQLRIQAECGEKDDKVVRASMDFALKGYEAFLNSKKVDPSKIEEELAGALDRILKIELTLRDLEGFLAAQKDEQVRLLADIKARKALLEEVLKDATKTQAEKATAQNDLVDLSKQEQAPRQIISGLNQEIEKCSKANRLALHTAAAFSSDGFLATDEESSEGDLVKRALSQAEAVVQYVQTEIEEKSKAAAREADEEKWRLTKWVNGKLDKPSHVEQLEKSGIEKSSFAVEIGALLLHTLPPNLEILAYSQFMAEHGCEVKADSIEGSVMQLLLSRDRREAGEGSSESVSPDLQRTMRLLQGCGVPKTDTQTFVTQAKAGMAQPIDLGDVQSLDAAKHAVMALIINHTFIPISSSSNPGTSSGTPMYGNPYSVSPAPSQGSDTSSDDDSDDGSQISQQQTGQGKGRANASAVGDHLFDDDSDDDGSQRSQQQTGWTDTAYNAASAAGNAFLRGATWLLTSGTPQ